MDILHVIFTILSAALVFCFIKIMSIDGILGKGLQLTFGHNYKYSKIDDHKLKRLLDRVDEGKVTANIRTGGYYLDFSSGDSIWIENKFYGYASEWKNHQQVFRVSKKQALRLYELELKLLNEVNHALR